MPEVQNVGAADYAQYQPSQYPNEVYADDYSTQPAIYDESMAEVQQASKSRLGLTILSVAVAAGIGIGGYFIGKRAGKNPAVDKDSIKAELENIKNSEAVKNYDKLKQAAEDVEKFVEEKSWYNFRGVKNKIKNAFGFLKEQPKKATEEVKEGAEKVADDAAKKTEEAAKNVENEAK